MARQFRMRNAWMYEIATASDDYLRISKIAAGFGIARKRVLLFCEGSGTACSVVERSRGISMRILFRLDLP